MRKLFYIIPYLLTFIFLIGKPVMAQSDWLQYNTGASLGNVSLISIVNENTLYITGYGIAPSGFFFMKSTNGGINWINVPGAISSRTQHIAFVNDNTGWIFATDAYIMKTTNSGQNWVSQTVPGVHIFYCNYGYFINEQTGWALGSSLDTGSHNYILRTYNGGTNWNVVYDKVSTTLIHKKIKFINQNTGWCVTNAGLNKTTDGGVSWFQQMNSLYRENVFFINEQTGWVCGMSTISKTTNGGANWVLQLNNWTYKPISDIFFKNVNTGYAVWNSRIIKTTNGGESWLKEYVEPGLFSTIKFVNENTGFVCCNGTNILKTTNAGSLTGIKKESEISSGFYLLQNYPNPFNPITNIKFVVSANSNVKIIIYDILGNELEVLVNSELSPGSYSVDFNAENYPSGAYFYRIEAGDFSDSKKMIIVK